MPYEDVTAPLPAEPQTATQAEFARIMGVTPPAVGAAIKSGRLGAAVAVDGRGIAYIVDVEAARAAWANNTRVGHVRRAENLDAAIARASPREAEAQPEGRASSAAPATPTPAVTPEPPAEMSPAQRKAHWDALEAERKFRVAAGEYVPASEVEAALTETFTTCKTRLLAIPSRAKQELPSLTLEAITLLERLIREACEDLAVNA